RLLDHARTTAQYSIYFGHGRDGLDVRGRAAHERLVHRAPRAQWRRSAHPSLFNVASGTYRGPSTQQGYSPFSTWTRGLAWAMLGFTEQVEFLAALPGEAIDSSGLLEAARATCDHYIDDASSADGIPFWDTGAPGLAAMPEWRDRPADPFNDREPLDSSAAAIAAQALLRLGRILTARGD